MLLAACLVAFLIYKTYVEGRLDHTYAQQGLVSPRLQAKYGDGAKAATSRYGLVDYLADAWSDNWANRTEIRRAAQQAAREAPAPTGRGTPRWRDRAAAFGQAAVRFGRRLTEPVETRPAPATSADPHRATDDPTPDTEVAVRPAGDDVPTHRVCPDCGKAMTEWPHGWVHPDGQLTCPPDPRTPRPGRRGTTPPPTRPNPTGRGKPVTAPTGEAVNYETTIAELDKLIAELQKQVDSLTAALAKVEGAKNDIGDAQGGYRVAAAAAAGILDHLAALNLDATTLGHLGAIKDSLPASAVDTLLEMLEEVEQLLKERLAAAVTALEAAEAAKAHVVAQYSAAHETVAGNLGGDPRFVGSGAAA